MWRLVVILAACSGTDNAPIADAAPTDPHEIVTCDGSWPVEYTMCEAACRSRPTTEPTDCGVPPPIPDPCTMTFMIGAVRGCCEAKQSSIVFVMCPT